MKPRANHSSPTLPLRTVFCFLLPLMMIFMTGCQLITAAPETTPTTAPVSIITDELTQSPQTEITPTPTATPTQEPTATPTEPPPTDTPTPAVTSAVTQAGLNKILNEIAELPNGTSGISLKQANAAAKVLDWAESADLSEVTLEESISTFIDTLSSRTDVAMFYINFNIISDIPQKIIDEHASTLGTVSDAGYTLQYASYTQEKWDTFFAAYQDCLPSMYTSYAHMIIFDVATGWAMFDYWDMLTGDAAVAWLVSREGYSETDAQTLVDGWADSEFIEKNTNPRLRVVDMSDVSIKMMYHADGSAVTDAIAVSLTFNEFRSLYGANPDGVLDSYFYKITVSGGDVTEVDQVYWP